MCSVREAKMTKSRAKWYGNPLLVGTLSGWVVGMLWWAGLMVAFGPSTAVTTGRGGLEEREITVLSRMWYAPFVAIPWAVVGRVAGAIASAVRGPWVPAAAALGTFAGGAYSFANSPFDGWLALTMPVSCLAGALVGSMIGAGAGFAWQALLGCSNHAESDLAPDGGAREGKGKA
jgi:hypothetical protein